MFNVRIEERVGKNKVVKAIQLRFNFLKKQKKLIIVAPTSDAATNISTTTIYRALSI